MSQKNHKSSHHHSTNQGHQPQSSNGGQQPQSSNNGSSQQSTNGGQQPQSSNSGSGQQSTNGGQQQSSHGVHSADSSEDCHPRKPSGTLSTNPALHTSSKYNDYGMAEFNVGDPFRTGPLVQDNCNQEHIM